MQNEFVFSGVGGQGILVASQLLGHAALAEGKRAMYFSMFMGAQRGGTCECLIAVADGRVDASPVIKQPLTANISMHPNAFLRFEPIVRPGGLIVYNTSITLGSSDTNAQTGMGMALKADARIDLSPGRPEVAYMGVPASELALNELGNQLMATLIAVGAFIELTKVVSLDSAREALTEALPAHRHHLVPLNRKALELGVQYARDKGVLQNPESLRLTGARALAAAM